MKRRFVLFVSILLFLFMGSAESLATVEWNILQTLKIEKKPRDVAMSVNGKWIYVLTDDGEVLIYSPAGNLLDRISVFPSGKPLMGSSKAPAKTFCCSPAAKTQRLRLSPSISSKPSMLKALPLKGRQMHRW